MKKKVLIRQKAFETNSSSSHSISVVDRPFVLDMPRLTEGEQILGEEEFGWGVDTHNDFWTKVQYCIVDGIDPELIRQVIENETGVIVDIQKGSGHIDHQSTGTAANELDGEPDKLRNFLFNKNSWLFISNDNGGPDHEDMERDTNLYMEDGSVVEFSYGYEIVVPGVGSARTRTYPTKAQIDGAFESMLGYVGALIIPENRSFIGEGRMEIPEAYWVFDANTDLPDKYDEDQPEHKKRFKLDKSIPAIDITTINEKRRGKYHFRWTDYDQKIIRFIGDDLSPWNIQDFDKYKNTTGYVELNYEVRKINSADPS